MLGGQRAAVNTLGVCEGCLPEVARANSLCIPQLIARHFVREGGRRYWTRLLRQAARRRRDLVFCLGFTDFRNLDLAQAFAMRVVFALAMPLLAIIRAETGPTVTECCGRSENDSCLWRISRRDLVQDIFLQTEERLHYEDPLLRRPLLAALLATSSVSTSALSIRASL